MPWIFILALGVLGWAAPVAVQCPAADCAPAAGMLVSVSAAGEPSYCSGTLIRPDAVLTAAHCVRPETCAGTVFHLPATKAHPREELACDRIEAITPTPPTEDHHDRPDWAVIRLRERAKRPPATIRETPLDVDEKVRTFPTRISPWATFAQMDRVTCQGAELGYLYPLTFHRSSPLLYARGCTQEIEKGNSGAGLFDQRGLLVGLVTAIVNPTIQDYRGESSRSILGTKIGCVPGSGLDPHGMCTWNPEDTAVDNLATVFSILRGLRTPTTNLASAGRRLTWEPAAEDRAIETFAWAYPNVEILNAQRALEELGQPELLNELRARVRAFVPRVPKCVRAAASGPTSWEESFPYRAIAFGDPGLDPNEDGLLYLARHADLTLDLRVRDLPTTVTITRVGDVFEVGAHLPPLSLRMSATEEAAIKACRDAQARRVEVCRGGGCSALELRNVQTPRPACRELYRRLSWRSAVQPIRFRVPGC